MFHGIQFPYFNSQQLNLDWIVDKIKGMLDFLPDDGTAGQILRRTADGAEWSDEQQVSGGAVDSVNGKTGDVVLDAGDILMDSGSTVEDEVDDLKSATGYLADSSALTEKFRTMLSTKIWYNGAFVNYSSRLSSTEPLIFPYDVEINNPFYLLIVYSWSSKTPSTETLVSQTQYEHSAIIPKNTYFTVTYSKSGNVDFDLSEASEVILTTAVSSLSNVESEIGSIENRLITVDGKGYYPVEISQFEFGGFTVYSDRITYWNTINRVRTKQNTTVHFGKGDTISLSSYDNASLFVAWKIDSVYYSTDGAITTTFTCPVDGEYVILINSVPDAQQSDVYNLYSLLQFTKGNNLIDRVTALESMPVGSVMHDYLIQKRSWLLHRNCVCVAHQGNYEYGTQNHCKAEGYRIAATRGFDYGECDIRFSSDGIPVCCHDDTFTDSSTSEEIVIANHTFAELQTYNFYGGKIASFDEIVSICKKYGIGLYIDQYGDNLPDAKYNAIFNVIGKYRFASKCKHMCYSEYAARKVLAWDETATIVCGQPYNSANIDTALALANAINSQYNKIELSFYIGLGDTIKNALPNMNPKYSVNVYFCETVEQKTEWSQIVDSILTNTHSLMELNEY